MSAPASSPADPLIASLPGRKRLASVQAAAVAGLVCAVGWSFALRGLLAIPLLGTSDEGIIRFYQGPRSGLSAVVLLQVLVVSTIGFLWFVGVVRNRIGDAEPKLFGTVFLGGAVLLAGLVFVGAAALAAPSILLDVGGKVPDPGAASLMRAFAAVILSVFAPRVAALVMFSTAGLGRASRALPGWLVIATYLTGVAELVNVTISAPNVYGFPAWIAVVSVVLLVRRPVDGFAIGEVSEVNRPRFPGGSGPSKGGSYETEQPFSEEVPD